MSENSAPTPQVEHTNTPAVTDTGSNSHIVPGSADRKQAAVTALVIRLARLSGHPELLEDIAEIESL